MCSWPADSTLQSSRHRTAGNGCITGRAGRARDVQRSLCLHLECAEVICTIGDFEQERRFASPADLEVLVPLAVQRQTPCHRGQRPSARHLRRLWGTAPEGLSLAGRPASFSHQD